MKLLPFERRHVLETTPCPRCSGTGAFAHGSRQQGPDCWNCRGLGRKPSLAALDLFYQICDRVGAPLALTAREGRFEPKHLQSVFGKELKPGMRITPNRRYPSMVDGQWPLTIEAIEELSLERKVCLSGGFLVLISDHHVFRREFTTKEIGSVQRFMARYVGRGVVDTKPTKKRAPRAVRVR